MPRFTRLLPWTALLALPALAFGPRDALAYRPPELEALATRAALARAGADYAELGLAGTAEINVQEDLAASLGIRLDLGDASRLRAKRTALEASARLRQAARDGVFRALKAHAGLWQAEARLKAARARRKAARLRLEAARLRGGPLAFEEAKGALEEAELDLRLALLERESAAQEAKALGLSGPAEPETLRFFLPAPRPNPLLQLEVEAQRARARAAERGLFALGLALSYQGELGYRIEAETQTPSLALTLGPKNPLEPPGAWKAELSARLSLDPVAWSEAESAHLAAREAEIAARRKGGERKRRLSALKTRAHLMERRLDLAKQALDLAKKKLEAARLREERGLLSALELEDQRAARFLAEARLAEAWGAYIEAVKAYLDLADGMWRER